MIQFLLNWLFAVGCLSRGLHLSLKSTAIYYNAPTIAARPYSFGNNLGSSDVSHTSLFGIPSKSDSRIVSRLRFYIQRLFWEYRKDGQSQTNGCTMKSVLASPPVLETQETAKVNNPARTMSDKDYGSFEIDQKTKKCSHGKNYRLLNEIVRAGDPLYAITEKEVLCIVNLYRVFPNLAIEHISNVLNGCTKDVQNKTYCDINTYLQRKDSSVQIYQNIYARLIKALDGHAMLVLRKIIRNSIEEEHSLPVYQKTEDVKYTPNDRLINEIIRASNPVYKLKKEEICFILSIYAFLPNKKIEYISSVLNGQTKNVKNITYSHIDAYVQNKGSSIQACQNIYARLSKALGGNAISIIRKKILKKTRFEKGAPYREEAKRGQATSFTNEKKKATIIIINEKLDSVAKHALW